MRKVAASDKSTDAAVFHMEQQRFRAQAGFRIGFGAVVLDAQRRDLGQQADQVRAAA